jgi:hypothetical protein
VERCRSKENPETGPRHDMFTPLIIFGSDNDDLIRLDRGRIFLACFGILVCALSGCIVGKLGHTCPYQILLASQLVSQYLGR